MKKRILLLSGFVALALLAGVSRPAAADEGKSEFALFDGTNPANAPNEGAVCGAKGLKAGKAFTYYVTVTNAGAAGFSRLTYADGDFVQFPLAAGASFSFSQAGGSKGGADRAVRVSNGRSGARLVGAMSVIGTESKPFCVSCDATSEGGVGDAACDAIVPN